MNHEVVAVVRGSTKNRDVDTWTRGKMFLIQSLKTVYTWDTLVLRLVLYLVKKVWSFRRGQGVVS